MSEIKTFEDFRQWFGHQVETRDPRQVIDLTRNKLDELVGDPPVSDDGEDLLPPEPAPVDPLRPTGLPVGAAPPPLHPYPQPAAPPVGAVPLPGPALVSQPDPEPQVQVPAPPRVEGEDRARDTQETD